MAEAPAEMKQTGESLGGSQFSFGVKTLNIPKYKYTAIPAQNQRRDLNLTSGSATAFTQFEIASGVMNLAQSELNYTITVADQGANAVSWQHRDTLPEISAIQLKSKKGTLMVNLTSDVGLYLKTVLPRETKLDDYLCHDDVDVVTKSNVPAILNPIPVAALGLLRTSTNYTEQKHLLCSPMGSGSAAATGAIDRVVRIKLGTFVETMLALDKDFITSETMTLRIDFSANQVGYKGTSNVDPTTGATTLVAGYVSASNACGALGGGATATCVYIKGLSLNLAVETRDDVGRKLQAMIEHKNADPALSGYRVMVPYVELVKTPQLSGTTGSNTVPLDASNGLFLRKAFTTATGTTETGTTAFDNCNLPAAAYSTTPGLQQAGKVHSFTTLLDNAPLQISALLAVMVPPVEESSDYTEQKRILKGSAIQGQLQHLYNWCWVEDFQNGNPSDGFAPAETFGGIDLTKKTRIYKFQHSKSTAQALNLYTWTVCTRVLQITQTGMEWSLHLPASA